MVHVVRRLVTVVEEMECTFLSAVKSLVKARKPLLILKAELDERRHILNIVHALAVRSFSDHREVSARNLAEKIVDIAAVLLAENHCRADYDRAVFAVSRQSLPVHILRVTFYYFIHSNSRPRFRLS